MPMKSRPENNALAADLSFVGVSDWSPAGVGVWEGRSVRMCKCFIMT